jgi:hypothetical protein
MPAVTPVTVLPFVPLTLQTTGVLDVKETVSNDEAAALAVAVPPTATEAGEKLIVAIV